MKLLVIAAVLGLAVSSSAQTTTPAPTGTKTPSPTTGQVTKSAADKAKSSVTTDHKFVTEAAQGGMAEVELGRLATQKASNDEVKKFGQKMVDDHSKVNDQLKSIASKKNIDLPSDVSKKDKELMDKLSKLSGPAFDKAYMQDMIKDHSTDVSEFTKASKSAKDPDIKSFAEKTLPTLQDHLKMARDTDRAVLKSNDKSQQPSTPSTSQGNQPKR